MKEKYTYVNGQITLQSEAKLLVSDLAIQRGYGVFDFLKIVNHRPIFIEDYLNRFYHSAEKMNLELPPDRSVLREAIFELLAKNNLPNSSLKMILTGGYSEDGFLIAKPNLILVQEVFEYQISNFEKGLNLLSHNFQRQFPSAKTIDYLQAIQLQPTLKLKQADDLLYHQNGQVRECPRANIFLVKGNEVITPITAILRGITRSKILSMSINGISIKEEDFSLDELINADEAFISSSTKNILPIFSLDGKPIGTGKTGKVTRKLHDKLLTLINEY